MGYKVATRVLVLQFENEDLDGLVVRARSMSMGRVLEVARLRDSIRTTGNQPDVLVDFFGAFVQCLESWNLEDAAGPVPQTVDGLLSLEMGLALMIVMTWFDSITAVSASLGKASTSGGQTLEESIPMEIG